MTTMEQTERGRRRLNDARLRTDAESRTMPRIGYVKIDRCRVHARNKRELGDLRELSASLGNTGAEHPVTVQMRGDWFEVVDGARRFWATKLAGRRRILAIIRPPRSDEEVVAAMLATDVHKRPMSPAERGLQVRLLKQEYDWTIGDCAAYLGVANSTVSRWLREARITVEGEADATAPAPAGRKTGTRTPKWKTKVIALRERWAAAVGEDGLGRDDALALLAELGQMTGEKQAA
jgi:ParB/RepB/Spo0J family partition protein